VYPAVIKIKNRVYGNKRGWVFTPQDFSDLAGNSSILMALSRLAKEKTIRRLAHGIYDYPIIHPKLGPIYPSAEEIARAAVRRHKTKLLPTGAYAANLAGISQQVPAKIVFFNSSIRRIIKMANMTIELKQTTPRNMATAGHITGIIIQALKHTGKEEFDNNQFTSLKKKLSAENLKQIKKDIRYASPAWIADILRKLAIEEQ
jgi:hypothetical protein